MVATSHCFAAAITWHGKHVRLCVWTPMDEQVQGYIAGKSSHPSGTQVPALGEEVET